MFAQHIIFLVPSCICFKYPVFQRQGRQAYAMHVYLCECVCSTRYRFMTKVSMIGFFFIKAVAK